MRRLSMTGALVVALLLGIGYLASRGVLVWLVLGVLVSMLARKRPRGTSHDPRAGEEAALKLKLLRVRLASAEARLEMTSPDVAEASRDRDAGKLDTAGYETALTVAGRMARVEKQPKGSRFRFR